MSEEFHVSHRHVFSMFCDDIRQEASGKSTLVGWHSGPTVEINSAPPLLLPKMCVLTHIVSPADQPFTNLALELRWRDKVLQRVEPDRDFIAGLQQSASASKTDFKGWQLNAAVSVQPLIVDQSGVLRVHVLIDDEVFVSNGLSFVFAPPASAPEESPTLRGSGS